MFTFWNLKPTELKNATNSLSSDLKGVSFPFLALSILCVEYDPGTKGKLGIILCDTAFALTFKSSKSDIPWPDNALFPNKSNPTNPITYNDINYKEIYKYVMRKNMKVDTENMTNEQLIAYRNFIR